MRLAGFLLRYRSAETKKIKHTIQHSLQAKYCWQIYLSSFRSLYGRGEMARRYAVVSHRYWNYKVNIQGEYGPVVPTRDQIHSQSAAPSLSHASISNDRPKSSPVFYGHSVPQRQLLCWMPIACGPQLEISLFRQNVFRGRYVGCVIYVIREDAQWPHYTYPAPNVQWSRFVGSFAFTDSEDGTLSSRYRSG